MEGLSPNEQLKKLLGSAKAEKTKATKYHNEVIERDGIRYDSKAEYNYKGRLDMLVASGEVISYLYHQKFPLYVEQEIIGHYEADFVVTYRDRSLEVVDIKSPATITPLFLWKEKHFRVQYGFPIIKIDSQTLQPMKDGK